VARKAGDRNRDFQSKRDAILEALEPRLLRADGPRATMHELATTANVSVSSLRHHLGSRSEVMAAVLARCGAKGEPFLAMVAAPTDLDLVSSLRWTLQMLQVGMANGVLDMLGFGMSVGMRDDVAGPACLNTLIEPLVQCVEARLDFHVQRGHIQGCDLRVAALTLVAPLLVAALHQQALGGCVVRPLSIPALMEEQVQRFARAYGAAPVA
jgi:AcrR family transcriptional regulator